MTHVGRRWLLLSAYVSMLMCSMHRRDCGGTFNIMTYLALNILPDSGYGVVFIKVVAAQVDTSCIFILCR